MIRVSAIGVAVLLSLPAYSTAMAQQGCEVIKSIVDNSPDKFRRLRGKFMGDGNYESKVAVPNVDECYISADPSYFSCQWRKFSSDTERLTQAKALGESLKTCLASYTEVRPPYISPNPGSVRYTFRLSAGPDLVTSVRLSANRDQPRIEMEVSTSER